MNPVNSANPWESKDSQESNESNEFNEVYHMNTTFTKSFDSYFLSLEYLTDLSRDLDDLHEIQATMEDLLESWEDDYNIPPKFYYNVDEILLNWKHGEESWHMTQVYLRCTLRALRALKNSIDIL